MNPRERARAAAREEKRDRALDALAARHRVTVAEDYVVGISVIAPVARPSGQPQRQTPLNRVKEEEPPPPPAPRPTPKSAPTPKQTPPARP
jgi:hypothetical protein